MQSSGTQLFLHLMRYLPSSVKTKSAYISSGFRPVKLVVTSFRLCSDAKREFSSPLYAPSATIKEPSEKSFFSLR